MELSAMHAKVNEFFFLLLKEVDALTELVNTDTSSPLCGCCQKEYWKGPESDSTPAPDFPNARCQEIAYSLALIYSTNLEGNVHYGRRDLLEIIKIIFKFWTEIQHADGSFDEWRKEEHGQPPTAFSLFAMSRAYSICKDHFDNEEKKAILESFHRAVDFLITNEELVATNHEVVSIAAIYSASLVLPDTKRNFGKPLAASITTKIDKIKRNFCDSEGWFVEIDGPDTGYNTVSLAYLSLYWSLSKDERVFGMMEKVAKFNRAFTFPGGLVGGGTNSRCAYINCPVGYAIIKDRNSDARELLVHFYNSLDLFTSDGRYPFTKYHRCVLFYMHFLAVCASAELEFDPSAGSSPRRDSGTYPKANIGIFNNALIYMPVGWGASIGALFLKKTERMLIFSSPVDWINRGGVFAELPGGEILSSTFKKNKQKCAISANSYECAGMLVPYSIVSENRWGIRKDLKAKTALFTSLKRNVLLLRYGRTVWFKFVRPAREAIGSIAAKKYYYERSISVDGATLTIRNRVCVPRDVADRVYAQEVLFSLDEDAYAFLDGNGQNVSSYVDALKIVDRDTREPILEFHFDRQIGFTIERPGKSDSKRIMQHAPGYITRLKFNLLNSGDAREYALDYTVSWHE
jgi:hypothetical protein